MSVRPDPVPERRLSRLERKVGPGDLPRAKPGRIQGLGAGRRATTDTLAAKDDDDNPVVDARVDAKQVAGFDPKAELHPGFALRPFFGRFAELQEGSRATAASMLTPLGNSLRSIDIGMART